MASSKIVIPNDLLRIKYSKLMVNDKKKATATINKDTDHCQLAAFSNPNVTYVYNVDDSKDCFDVNVCGGCFNFLNIAGNLEVNFPQKYQRIHWHFYGRKDAQQSDYSGYDYLKSKKLTINHPNGYFKFGVEGEWRSDTLPLEELEINSATAGINLRNLNNLKSIKLKTSSKTMDRIYIDNCPKLEKLDLSTCIFFENGALSLNNIPNKCKLLINPSAKICAMVRNPIENDGLKRIFEWDEHRSLDGAYTFAEILNIPENKEPYEISVIDFKKRLLNFTNNRTKKLWEESLAKENEEIQFIEKNINLSPEEFKQAKLAKNFPKKENQEKIR